MFAAFRSIAALCLGLLLAGAGYARADDRRAYAGSEACAGCHQAAFQDWRHSHHGWALREPTPESVLGDFGGASFKHDGVVSRFLREGDAFVVETPGPDGTQQRFPVRYAVGVAPLQQYLVETGDGRLQVLDLAWDTVNKAWFHLYPDAKLGPGDGLHWTRSYKNWQARCADCHQTGFDKGFDSGIQSYRSSWTELTVSCESCHGPSKAHADWAQSRTPGSKAPAMFKLGPGQQANELAACGPCHSRREAFAQTSAPFAAAFGDHYNLSLLTPDLYFADGQQNAEVFILGSFLQSKMKAKGVTCSNCHDAHAGKLVADGNAVCTQCHNPAGNTGFPSLRKADYDSAAHTHHAPGTEAAQCVTCHMPERTYMVKDARRDHFFRIPDPLQSQAAGAPDVCTTCHTDRDPRWAAAQIDGWAPRVDRSWQDRGAFIAFSKGERTQQVFDALAAYALDRARPDIVRATAVVFLREGTGPRVDERLKALLADPSDLVRVSAPSLFRQVDPLERQALLAPLLGDRVRAVRQAAAVELSATDAAGLDRAGQDALAAGIDAYLQSRLANADMPEAHMALGGLALNKRQWPEAEAAFKEATRLDPQLEQGWVTLARLRSALGDEAGAEAYLAAGLQALPDGQGLLFERGALDERRGRFANAVGWYRRITTRDPQRADAWLALSAAALRGGQPGLAVDAAGRAIALEPRIAEAYVMEAYGHYLMGDLARAKESVLKARTLAADTPLPPELEALTK